MQRQFYGGPSLVERRLVDALCWCFGGTLTVFALAYPVSAQDVHGSPTLDYNVDLSLGYTDLLRRASTTGGPKAVIEAPTDRPRTLGLRHAKIGFSLQRLGDSSLTMTLRPDALARRGEEPPREFDSRAGATQRRTPIIELADTYAIAWEGDQSYAAGFGVYDHIAPPRASYDSPLGFGLEAILPRKVLALRLTWRTLDLSEPTAPNSKAFGRLFDFYVFEGNEDRGEVLSRSTASYDTAPTADNPTRGLAASIAFCPHSDYDIGATVAFEDGKIDSGGRRNEMFGVLSGAARFPLIGQYATKVTWDSRLSREYWRGTPERVHSLAQVSHALTLSHEVVPRTWVMWGIHYGTSQRAPEGDKTKAVLYDGWQGDLGISRHVDDQLSLTLMATNESRHATLDGVTIGGFSNELSTRPGLKRFALEVRYRLE